MEVADHRTLPPHDDLPNPQFNNPRPTCCREAARVESIKDSPQPTAKDGSTKPAVTSPSRIAVRAHLDEAARQSQLIREVLEAFAAP